MFKNRRDLYHRMRLLIHPQFDMISDVNGVYFIFKQCGNNQC